MVGYKKLTLSITLPLLLSGCLVDAHSVKGQIMAAKSCEEAGMIPVLEEKLEGSRIVCHPNIQSLDTNHLLLVQIKEIKTRMDKLEAKLKMQEVISGYTN